MAVQVAGPAHAGPQLLDGLQRILRSPGSGWVLLALHLSRVTPPGPRAHHRRIGLAMLEDAAGRTAGQLYPLANGDIVLLFRAADGGVMVADMLSRLFTATMPDAATARSVWPLPEGAAAALAYARERAAEPAGPAPMAEPLASAGVIAAMDSLVRTAATGSLMHRQTGVLVRPGKAERMTPLLREVAISTAAMERGVRAAGRAAADPFLFQHLAGLLDRRIMATLLEDIPAAGPLSRGLNGAVLHVNLTLAGVLSDRFSTLAELCRPAGPHGVLLGVELPFVEVFADSRAFILARQRLKLADIRMVLDGVTHQALVLMNQLPLQADLLKLNWSPAMTHEGAELREAVARFGADKIVLHRAESEAALCWGLSHGIQRFQGRYIDRMLAVERLRACPMASGCTLHQCDDRAAAAGRPGRAGCGQEGLLDRAMPALAQPGPGTRSAALAGQAA